MAGFFVVEEGEAIDTVIGVVLGAVIAFAGVWWNNRNQNKREIRRLAVEAALGDYKARIESKTGAVPPLTAFIFYHSEVIKLLDEDKLTAEEIKKLEEKLEKVLAVLPPKLNGG